MIHAKALHTQRSIIRKSGEQILEQIYVTSREEALELIGRMRSDRSDESLIVETTEVFQ